MNRELAQHLNKNIYLEGRKILIERCLGNLIDNSIKYAIKVHIKLLVFDLDVELENIRCRSLGFLVCSTTYLYMI